MCVVVIVVTQSHSDTHTPHIHTPHTTHTHTTLTPQTPSHSPTHKPHVHKPHTHTTHLTHKPHTHINNWFYNSTVLCSINGILLKHANYDA